MRLDDACHRFLGFARGWEGNWSTNYTRFPFLCSAEASENWALAPSTLSSRSLTSDILLIIYANALMTGSNKGVGGDIAGGGVTVQGELEVKGVSLGFPLLLLSGSEGLMV